MHDLCCFYSAKASTNCSSAAQCKKDNCVLAWHVCVLASEQKSRGKPEDRKTNLSRPLQYISLSISASPSLTLFHPIDPISWQTDLHLMQQQLCGFWCVYMYVCVGGHFGWLYVVLHPNQTFTFLPLACSASILPPSSLTTSASIYLILRNASSLSSVQGRQTRYYPSMQVLIHCPSVYVLF